MKVIALTHWGRVTHICVSKHTIIGSNNGLSPGRRQAIIWTNAGILLIGTLGTKFSEILIENRIFSFKKIGLNVSSTKWRPFCLGLNVLYSERPRGAGFRSVNPAERWRENPARALARAGFSQHLECGIHRSESSPEGSFALIPYPVARWAKTTP